MDDMKPISGGVVHDLPGDLEEALKLNPEALSIWEDVTPLARNEWICWIESALKRIDWGCSSLEDGNPARVAGQGALIGESREGQTANVRFPPKADTD